MRESELERAIADLGAALVVARNKEINRLKTAQNGDISAGSDGNDISALRTRLENAEDHVETLTVQLDLERQRVSSTVGSLCWIPIVSCALICMFVRNVIPTKLQTLHQELEEISKERTEEAAAAHARHLQNDRKIADMSVTISRLQSNLRDAKGASFDDSRDSINSFGGDDKTMQIKTLSEQVLRQQELIGQGKSEISALKSRLQGAIRRAEKAEGAMSSFQNSDDIYDRMESAPLSGGSNDGRRTMRRRGHGNSNDSYGGSIRSAIRLSHGQGESTAKIGKAIDVVDSFSVQTGVC